MISHVKVSAPSLPTPIRLFVDFTLLLRNAPMTPGTGASAPNSLQDFVMAAAAMPRHARVQSGVNAMPPRQLTTLAVR
jgi:hypothetical protein